MHWRLQPFGEGYASLGRVANVLPVDVEIPGCPPSPAALLAGILAAISARATPAREGGQP
jgi:Ni,Fe-hydrogenase III small subunit